MSQASDYLETQLINHIFRNISYTSPTTVYCALYTATPSDAGGGSEIATSGSYARQAITFGPQLTGSVANTNVITFGPATLPWGTLTSFAIFDASTGGNMLVWNSLNSSIAISAGDSAQFASASLGVTVL